MIATEGTTRLWMRNAGDERAAANGCAFDVLRGAYTVWWIERFCKLYEGEGYAGHPVVLHGCHQCDHSDFYATTEDFWLDDECTIPGPAQAIHDERARLFAECVAAGHRIDWQYETFMRLFGWIRESEKWGRWIRRFRQASVWVPKKSKKSPSLAALGMYLLCGDGEPGQKVFLAAKDGDQARKNAAKHAVEMWLQSDELREACTLNRTVLQLTHESSRSVMYPLSSSNTKTQESKEGLNGSVLVDETHVVDKAFVKRITRAGISRSEPLYAEFSTAGNNPDSYGKERFDYCSDVLSGKVIDEELLSIVYAAPQDVTDEQLETDFQKYARMANPALGHTIDPEEIRRDYERSKVTIEQLCDFKMYRLNVWQHSSNPWIKPSDWAACAAEYTEQDLLGRECYGGLDLSIRWDTTAFVLLFPWGDHDPPHFRIWPYFFLPEVSARKTKDKAAWFEWDKKGDLRLTDGNVTDFPAVRKTIVAAREKFDLRCVAFDDRFADVLAQALQDEDGIEMVNFNQSLNNFTEPMGLFEQDVIAHRMQHPNNLCLNWQAGNATKNRKGMLVKPESDDVKKIDGITGAVMARDMATNHKGAECWSREDGVTL
jgi:phage terminase large subunit-like protein